MEKPEIFIHGNVDEEEKKEEALNIKEVYEKGYSSNLSQKEIDKLLHTEKPKTPIDLEIINLSNTLTNELLTKYGLKPFDLKENNVHIIDTKLYKKFAGDLENTDACYQASHQAIFVEDIGEEPITERVGKILHETIHFKGFQSYQIFEFQDKKSKNPNDSLVYQGPFRAGLKVSSSLRKMEENDEPFSVRFKGLNEAVVVELERKLLPDLITRAENIPKEPYLDFEEKTRVAPFYNIDPSEIEFVFPSEGSISTYAYPDEREVLSLLVESILQDDSSLNRDEVMDKFFRAHFSGNILEIARLIEKSFGKGSFRILADMNDYKSSEKVKEILMGIRSTKNSG
jgi:hypothetical protein